MAVLDKYYCILCSTVDSAVVGSNADILLLLVHCFMQEFVLRLGIVILLFVS